MVACSRQPGGLTPRDGLEASTGQHVRTWPFPDNKLCGSLVEEAVLGMSDKIPMRTGKGVEAGRGSAVTTSDRYPNPGFSTANAERRTKL